MNKVQTPSISKEFYQKLKNSFKHIFVEQNSKDEILCIIKAIENNEPILDLMENASGSFSTIFLPFHWNEIYPYHFKKISKKYNLTKKLIEFCKLAGEIESITSNYAFYEKEQNGKEKAFLLSKLKEFFKILPSYEEFQAWLK
jgi:hypothetical protein